MLKLHSQLRIREGTCYWASKTAQAKLPEEAPHVANGQFPTMHTMLGDSIRSLSKVKKRVAMEALEKFDDEIGKSMR